MGQQRIFLAHGLVAHDGHFAIPPFGDFGTTRAPTHPARCARALARCGLKRDDPTPLKEAQDALARATHDGLDLLLRGRGRRVEHLASAVDIWPIDTVEKNPVKMWIESEVAVGALDDGHGAGFAGRQAAVDMAPPIP
jgi:hypothetical protein